MAASLATCFLVIVPNYYGVASTLDEAVRNVRREGAPRTRLRATVLAFDCPRDKVEITAGVGVAFTYPEDAHCLRFDAKI